MIEVLKNVNIGLSFLLELAMLAALGYWGFYGEKSIWLKWALGLGLPVLAAILWGLLLAPHAAHRLEYKGGLGLSTLLFLLAAAALFFAQQRELAIAFAVIVMLNRILIRVWMQW
jgi:hypothetical protein